MLFSGEKREIRYEMYDVTQATGQSNGNRVGQLTFQESPQKWQLVKGTFLLDNPCFFDKAMTKQKLGNKIQKCLDNVAKAVKSSVVMIDNEFLAPETYLNPRVKKIVAKEEKAKKGGGGKGKGGKGKEFN